MKEKKTARTKRNQQKVQKAIQPARQHLDAWILAILVVVAFLAFARTIPYAFVYDDEYQILRNPWIRDWSNLGRIFTTDVWQFRNNTAGSSNYYRPIHMLLHMVGFTLSGFNPSAFHLINIALHCFSTLLVALIGFRLTSNRELSLASGLIFALHPIHAESVSWIAAVPDLACAVFYFGALYFYLRDMQEPSRHRHIALSMLLFWGALLSKEMAFTFPIVASWADFSLNRRLRWSRYAMIASIFGIYSVQRINALGRFFVQQLSLELDPVSQILTRVDFLARYLRKAFVPYDISAFHVFQPTTSVLSGNFILALLTLGMLGCCAWYLRERKAAVFLFGFSLISLAPILNISGIGENVFADRYLYIPTLASCLLIPMIAHRIWAARPSSWRWQGEYAGIAALSALMVLFGVMLWNTIFMWKDVPTLYSETMKRSPTAVLINNSLARYYISINQLDKAEELFRKSLTLWDKNYIKYSLNLTSAYSGLGGIYFKRRNMQQAEYYFNKAREINPDTLDALQNLGSIYLAMGDLPKALEVDKRALDINPRNEVSWNNLSVYYLTTKQYDQAIECARKALEIFPELCEPYLVLTRAYVRKGMIPEARSAYEAARRIDPSKANLVAAELSPWH